MKAQAKSVQNSTERADFVQTWVELYRANGWQVFPVCHALSASSCVEHGSCRHPGKTPLVKWSKYRDGEMTELEMSDQWSKFPDANIGLVTGDIVVLDIDGDVGKASLGNRPLPSTGPRLTTGRLGGMHYLFDSHGVPISNSAGSIDHVDVRGIGGYSVLPPSIHHTMRDYKWVEESFKDSLPPVPDWLLDLSQPAAPLNEPPHIDGVVLGYEARDFFANGAALGRQRERAVKAARNALTVGLPFDQIVDLLMQGFANSDQDPSNLWTIKDAETIVESLMKSKVPELAPLGKSGILGINVNGSVLRQEASTAKIFTLKEFVTSRKNEGPKTLVEGIIDKGRTHWLWAMPGSGKTLWSLDLAFSIVEGRPYHGRAVVKSKVLLIERDSTNQLDDYIEMVARSGNYNIEALEEGFHISDDESLHCRDKQGVASILKTVDSIPGIELVICDSYREMVSLSAGWGQQTEHIKQLKSALEERGTALLMLDHSVSQAGYVDRNGNSRDPLETLYGGAMKQAVFDTGMWAQGKLKDGPLVIRWAKLRQSNRDDLIVEFTEDDGFSVRVNVTQDKLWEDLSKKEQALMQHLFLHGPLAFLDAVEKFDFPRPALSRSLVNRLIPRGLIERRDDGVLVLGVNGTLSAKASMHKEGFDLR